jgi:DNA-directed RNA polymerase specialized sigma subunit
MLSVHYTRSRRTQLSANRPKLKPVFLGEKIRKMARAYNALSEELRREPSDEELAERLLRERHYEPDFSVAA